MQEITEGSESDNPWQSIPANKKTDGAGEENKYTILHTNTF